MDEALRSTLRLAPDASGAQRTIDITTYGARSGAPRRIEIWFHYVDGRWYLTGSPGRRDWYANLRADPRLIVHLKRSVRADLPATARPITDPAERRAVFEPILAWLRSINPSSPQSYRLQDWLDRSPLAEITFDDPV